VGDADHERRAWRVVQWTTGKTGRAAVRAMVDHPAIEIVGCYAWSADKVGRDVGQLCRLDPIGVTTTDDLDALIALRPDCVVYMPYRPEVDHVVRILESGTNIVTSLYQLVGDGYDDDAQERIADAARRGDASLYAGGTYPGHVPMVALSATAVCSSIERITLLESVDLRGYANEPMYRAMGIDRDPTDPEAAVLIEAACGSFRDQVAVMADALALDLDDITFHADFAVADDDLDVGFMTIGKGRVAAIRGTISGMAGGRSRIECRSVWKMGERTNPDWPVEHGYVIDVDGTPSFRVRIEPGDGWTGSISTALPIVNAIPAVCEAAPGVLNFGELPFVRGKHALR
jgi:2,4-diaminopentanoate dehydrogenase